MAYCPSPPFPPGLDQGGDALSNILTSSGQWTNENHVCPSRSDRPLPPREHARLPNRNAMPPRARPEPPSCAAAQNCCSDDRQGVRRTWIKFAFPSAVEVVRYRLWRGQGSDSRDRSPVTWKLYATTADDCETGRAEISSVTATATPSSGGNEYADSPWATSNLPTLVPPSPPPSPPPPSPPPPSPPPSLPPGCDGSAVNTWQPTWASSADAACALWAVSDDWGALVGGQTAEEACLTPWAQDECAATCCTYSSEDQPTPVDVEVCVIAAEGDLPKLDGLSVSGGLSGVQKWGPNPD